MFVPVADIFNLCVTILGPFVDDIDLSEQVTFHLVINNKLDLPQAMAWWSYFARTYVGVYSATTGK